MIQLYNANCLEQMKSIEDKSIDLILCDLPYGTTACKWDSVIPFNELWAQYNRIIKDNGNIVLFGTEPFSTQLRNSNLKNFRYDWIWDKVTATGMGIVKYKPMRQHEIISVFGKGKLKYYPIMEKMEKPDCYKNYKKSQLYNKGLEEMQERRVRTHKYPKTILKFSNAKHKGNLHPTQKPVALLEYLIKTYTQEGDLVLDNCMGSGSTGVACKHLNRDFIGIEIDENYFKIAEERIKNED